MSRPPGLRAEDGERGTEDGGRRAENVEHRTSNELFSFVVFFSLASHRDASVGVREYWSVGLQRLTQVA